MKSHKVSDRSKASLAQGVCRGYVQGKPAGLQQPFGSSNLSFEVDYYSEMPLHLESSQMLCWQKLCVYLYLVDHRLCKNFPFSIWRKGHWLVTGRCPFMQHKFGWQQSLWKHYKEFVRAPRALLIAPVWQWDNFQYVWYASLIPFMYVHMYYLGKHYGLTVFPFFSEWYAKCCCIHGVPSVWEMGNNWKRKDRF